MRLRHAIEIGVAVCDDIAVLAGWESQLRNLLVGAEIETGRGISRSAVHLAQDKRAAVLQAEGLALGADRTDHTAGGLIEAGDQSIGFPVALLGPIARQAVVYTI